MTTTNLLSASTLWSLGCAYHHQQKYKVIALTCTTLMKSTTAPLARAEHSHEHKHNCKTHCHDPTHGDHENTLGPMQRLHLDHSRSADTYAQFHGMHPRLARVRMSLISTAQNKRWPLRARASIVHTDIHMHNHDPNNALILEKCASLTVLGMPKQANHGVTVVHLLVGSVADRSDDERHHMFYRVRTRSDRRSTP